MKWKSLMITAAALSSLLLSACGAANNNANDTATGNQNDNKLRNVTYHPNNNTFGTNRNYNVNNNGYQNRTNNTGRYYDLNNANVNYRNNNNSRMAVADKAADKVVSLREVDQANVIVTDNNAYVAAKLANNIGTRLEKNIEKKISDAVKSTDRNIDNVYVSVNPDFYTRTTSYANDIRSGHPVEGFFEEFTTLTRRIFPTQR